MCQDITSSLTSFPGLLTEPLTSCHMPPNPFHMPPFPLRRPTPLRCCLRTAPSIAAGQSIYTPSPSTSNPPSNTPLHRLRPLRRSWPLAFSLFNTSTLSSINQLTSHTENLTNFSTLTTTTSSASSQPCLSTNVAHSTSQTHNVGRTAPPWASRALTWPLLIYG